MSQILRWIKDRVSDWTGFCYSLHFFGSAVIVIIGVHFGLSPLHAVGISVLLGVLKEVFDVARRKNNGDLMDTACNLCGAFVGWLFVQ